MSTSLAIWLGITLLLSIILNIFTIWYIAKIISKFTFISENLNDLVTVVNNYKEHLKQVYKMEMFYGDETLRHLIRHAKDITDVFDAYDDYPDENTEMYDYDNDYEQAEEA